MSSSLEFELEKSLHPLSVSQYEYIVYILELLYFSRLHRERLRDESLVQNGQQHVM